MLNWIYLKSEEVKHCTNLPHRIYSICNGSNVAHHCI